MVLVAKNFVTTLKIYAATFLNVREITVHWILFRTLVAYFCHHLSDNKKDLFNLYVKIYLLLKQLIYSVWTKECFETNWSCSGKIYLLIMFTKCHLFSLDIRDLFFDSVEWISINLVFFSGERFVSARLRVREYVHTQAIVFANIYNYIFS